MARRAHPRCGVHGDPDVAGLGQRGAARMDADADADLAASGPSALLQTALDRDRGREEPLPSLLARGIVLERGLIETCERVPDMRRIVDRQAPPALRVDVGERAGR